MTEAMGMLLPQAIAHHAGERPHEAGITPTTWDRVAAGVRLPKA